MGDDGIYLYPSIGLTLCDHIPRTVADLDARPQNIQKGVREGCSFCLFIHENITQFFTYEDSTTLESLWRGQSKGLLAKDGFDGFSASLGDLILSVPENDRLASIFLRRPPLKNFDSEDAYDLISQWMNECALDHTLCPKPGLKRLPKRLVDVGSAAKEPSLFQNSGSTSGIYAALSYCWGNDQPTTLKTGMIQSEQTSFPMNALPPTLRDAIIICRKLNIQYIWIDALCIIQDSISGEDWQRESSVMDQIYGNAVITIAASAAHDTSEGILRSPKEPKSGIRTVSYYVYLEGIRYDGKALAQFYPYAIDDQQPLASRAWAFQESLLSPRVLSYQCEQLVWECATKKVYANGPANIDKIMNFRRIERSWEESVKKYTSCHLTFDDDRLAALAGYAKSRHMIASPQRAMSGNPSDEYLAGLWRSNANEHLLWYIKEKTPRLRPKGYRAPTWSWGSVSGPIEYVASEAKGSAIPGLDIIRASVTRSKLNPYGSLEASPPSYVVVLGYLRPVPEMMAPSKDGRMPDQKPFRRGIGRSWWITFDILDVTESPRPYTQATVLGNNGATSLWCLRTSEHTALIVIQVIKEEMEEKGNVFERVGFVRHWVREEWTWFDEVKEKTTIYLV